MRNYGFMFALTALGDIKRFFVFRILEFKVLKIWLGISRETSKRENKLRMNILLWL